jgi:hypothetical protein
VAVIVAVLVYAVTQANEGVDTGPTGWQKAQADGSNLPGTYIPPHPGEDGRLCEDATCIGRMDDRNHVANGTVIPLCTSEQLASGLFNNPVCYQSNPPTSGPHAASPMPLRVLENPAPKENLVHNMEHGAVVIWYNTSNQDVIRQLESIANDAIDRRKLITMSRYTEMEPETIALTAWTRLDKFPASDFQRKRVQDFIDEHERRFNPEGF